MEYENWFGPQARNFQTAPAIPLLQSADMLSLGGGYDSADPAVIQTHIEWFQYMGVDAALIKVTNNVSCIFNSQCGLPRNSRSFSYFLAQGRIQIGLITRYGFRSRIFLVRILKSQLSTPSSYWQAIDSQPDLWANQGAAAGPVEISPSYGLWSWVDRLNPTCDVQPFCPYYPSYNRAGSRVENFTVSIATNSQA